MMTATDNNNPGNNNMPLSLPQTYRAHNATAESPIADIFDAAYEYYTTKHPMDETEEEADWMLKIEALADTAATHFAN